jgi:hypothetical protein
MPQPTPEAIRRTTAFARVIGPFVVTATLIVAIRLPGLTGLVADLFDNSVLPWLLGANPALLLAARVFFLLLTLVGVWLTCAGWVSRRARTALWITQAPQRGDLPA